MRIITAHKSFIPVVNKLYPMKFKGFNRLRIASLHLEDKNYLVVVISTGFTGPRGLNLGSWFKL